MKNETPPAPPGKVYNTIIIGAGPAGLAASIALGSEMDPRTVLVIDSKPSIGGQAGQSSMIENYPGFVNGVTGSELTGYFMEQASRFTVDFLAPVTVSEIGAEADLRFVIDDDRDRHYARSVIIAGGLSYNKLKVIDLPKYLGRGIYYGDPGTSVAGKNVYIVGAANSAGQAAAKFASHEGAQVHILARKDSIAGEMSQYLIEKLDRLPNVQVHYRTEVVGVIGNGKLDKLVLKTTAEDGTSNTVEVEADVMSIFIGASPKTKWLRDCGFDCDARGYIFTGNEVSNWPLAERRPSRLETCMPGVFAIGDIRAGSVKRIVTAAGAGGEVAPEVHAYLATLKAAA